MNSLLQSRASRLFFVALIVLLIGSVALWYWSLNSIHLTKSYFWTQERNAGIDIRSPTRRAIIDASIYPSYAISSYENYQRALQLLNQRCDPAELASRQIFTAGALWRDVELCNAAGLTGEEFDVANQYFRSRVDELYSQLYLSMTVSLLSHILAALVIWGFLFVAWRTCSWVMAGNTSKR
jgi:hypothetical protein